MVFYVLCVIFSVSSFRTVSIKILHRELTSLIELWDSRGVEGVWVSRGFARRTSAAGQLPRQLPFTAQSGQRRCLCVFVGATFPDILGLTFALGYAIVRVEGPGAPLKDASASLVAASNGSFSAFFVRKEVRTRGRAIVTVLRTNPTDGVTE